MPSITFKKDSHVHKLHVHFSDGKSITHDEATKHTRDGGLSVKRLAQRVADLKKKFEEANVLSPIMVIAQADEDGHKYARYFYKGSGCALENNKDSRSY